MNTYDFKDSIKVGCSGEQKIMNWLNSRADVVSVKDVSRNPKYQKCDIDFIVDKTDGKSYTVEIKTDTYTSGNFFFETMSAIETNSCGCLYKTLATNLFYYFVNSGELYIIDMPEFRKWFNENKDKSMFRRKEVKNKRRNGDFYTTEGYTFPKKYMEQTFKGYKKVILK